jgi:hypothetical protein
MWKELCYTKLRDTVCMTVEENEPKWASFGKTRRIRRDDK